MQYRLLDWHSCYNPFKKVFFHDCFYWFKNVYPERFLLYVHCYGALLPLVLYFLDLHKKVHLQGTEIV